MTQKSSVRQPYLQRNGTAKRARAARGGSRGNEAAGCCRGLSAAALSPRDGGAGHVEVRRAPPCPGPSRAPVLRSGTMLTAWRACARDSSRITIETNDTTKVATLRMNQGPVNSLGRCAPAACALVRVALGAVRCGGEGGHGACRPRQRAAHGQHAALNRVCVRVQALCRRADGRHHGARVQQAGAFPSPRYPALAGHCAVATLACSIKARAHVRSAVCSPPGALLQVNGLILASGCKKVFCAGMQAG